MIFAALADYRLKISKRSLGLVLVGFLQQSIFPVRFEGTLLQRSRTGSLDHYHSGRALLEAGSLDMDLQDNSVYHVLPTAVLCCRNKAVQVLLEEGADFKTCDSDGRTSLFHSDSHSNWAMASSLVPCVKRPNQKDLFGRTHLHVAAEQDFMSWQRTTRENKSVAYAGRLC